ncbi:hypothetical protein PHMEG_00030092 [Phytophthora megakarya]|uniref:Uncharacterized protein n=1 Tax=Phytophthora megakarya TaxID=4795 RepID=A0A225V161_9STRA|nr:hypothetical protein PHMEG_00030092 [Phytophthora megakarya]
MNAILNHIIAKVKLNENADARAISEVHDCFEKFELFMDNRLCVVNQQRAIGNH